MKQTNNPETNRRSFIKTILAGLGGLGVGGGAAGLEQITKALEENPGQNLMPVATAKAASPTNLEAQYRGSPKNQGHLKTTESPTNVKNIQTSHEGTPIARSPITSPDGTIAGITDGGAVFTDTNGNEISTANLTGEPRHGFWHNGDFIVGDAEKTAKINPDTGEIISTLENEGGSMAKTSESAYRAIGGAVQEFDPDTMEPLETYDTGPTSSKSINMIEEDNVLVSNAPDPNAFDTENNQQIDQISVQGLNPWLSIDNEYVYGNTFDEIQARKIPKQQGEEFELVDTEFFNGGSYAPPTIVSENEETFLYSGTFDEHDDLGYTVQGYSFDGETIEEEWRQEVPGTVAETMAVGDTLIASGVGLTGFNRHTGEQLFQEEIIGRAGIPYQNKIPVGDANNDKIHILEMETQNLGGEQPELSMGFQNMPDQATLGETIEYDFVLQNSGTGEWTGDIEFQYTGGDSEQVYKDSITTQVHPGEVEEILNEYTPEGFDDSSFQFSYDSKQDLIQVTVPTLIEDGSTTNNITGTTPEDTEVSSNDYDTNRRGGPTRV